MPQYRSQRARPTPEYRRAGEGQTTISIPSTHRVREEITLTAEVARPLPLPVLVGDALLETTRPFPIEVTGLQDDVAGAGCASGVTGSPWWNVDVP